MIKNNKEKNRQKNKQTNKKEKKDEKYKYIYEVCSETIETGNHKETSKATNLFTLPNTWTYCLSSCQISRHRNH